MIRNDVPSSRSRRLRQAVGFFLLLGFAFQAHQAWLAREPEVSKVSVRGPDRFAANVAYAAEGPRQPSSADTLEQRAARDPIAFLQDAIHQYDRTVRDYTCVFTKQERLGGKLSRDQVMKAMFREKPFSVRLEWTRNADKCDRVLYVKDRWIDEGRQMAVVEPGWLARTFVSYVMRPIHGEDAERSSRRTIDQFGVRNALVLTLKYALMAREKGILDFRYVGMGEVDGRETLVFERHLPYSGEDDRTWPDRILVMHLDRELLLPALCLSYADDERQVLLGKYMTTQLKLNVNLPAEVFTKEGMGL
jgi:hypothetical protein